MVERGFDIVCKRLIKGWEDRYPYEWNWIFGKGRLDKPLREVLANFYKRKWELEWTPSERRDVAACWLYWVLHRVFKIPASKLDTLDIRALVDPSVSVFENLAKFAEESPELRAYLNLKEALEEPEDVMAYHHEMEEKRARGAEEADIFCSRHPDICERYPIIPRYIEEAMGVITADDVEDLLKYAPELVPLIDGYTLEEALEEVEKRKMKGVSPVIRRLKKEIEQKPWLATKLDTFFRTLEKAMKEVQKTTEAKYEEYSRITEWIRRFNPPSDIQSILLDPAIPDDIKESVMKEWEEMMRKEEEIKRIKPPPIRKPKVPKKREGLPKLIPEIRIVREEIRVKMPEYNIYESPESEKRRAEELLYKQYGIEPIRIDFIIKISEDKWAISGVDKRGRSFYKIVKLR